MIAADRLRPVAARSCGAAGVGAVGREGEILAKVVVHSLILTTLVGLLALVQAYVVGSDGVTKFGPTVASTPSASSARIDGRVLMSDAAVITTLSLGA